MASNSLRRRVIHFANLPLKLVMPSSCENIREIAFKTIPSASKIEIKRVLESLYGFQVKNVNTVNIAGKKKKRRGFVFTKPDYKKAYVTLRRPLSLPSHLFPVNLFKQQAEAEAEAEAEQEQQQQVQRQKQKARPKHWLEDERSSNLRNQKLQQKQQQQKHATAAPWRSKLSWK